MNTETSNPSLHRNEAPPLLDFRTIYELELDYVWRSLRRLGVPERDVEDTAHDLWLSVYGKLGTYDRARPLRPWLFGFAYRFASDYRKKARVRHEEIGQEVDERPTPGAHSEEKMIETENRNRVLSTLEELAPEPRAVFVLHELDGIAIPEVARSLDIPLNTAYSRLRSAREEFKTRFQKHIKRGEA